MEVLPLPFDLLLCIEIKNFKIMMPESKVRFTEISKFSFGSNII